MSDEQIEQVTPATTEAVTTPSEVTSTPEIETSETAPVTSLDDAKKLLAKQKSKSSAPTAKPTAGPTTDYEKQYKEIQSLVGKQSKELGELRKFYSQNQPVIDSYKQFLAQQQEQEMLSKYQQDPQAVIKELARREAQAQIAPYQEQMSQAQATQINSNIKEQLGADYDTFAPVMAELLDNFLAQDQKTGSNYATELAQNPHVLMQMAAGKLALEQRYQQHQQSQVAAQTKAKNLQVAGGVGKANNVTSAPTDNFGNLSLDEMRVQMKKMGLIK